MPLLLRHNLCSKCALFAGTQQQWHLCQSWMVLSLMHVVLLLAMLWSITASDHSHLGLINCTSVPASYPLDQCYFFFKFFAGIFPFSFFHAIFIHTSFIKIWQSVLKATTPKLLLCISMRQNNKKIISKDLVFSVHVCFDNITVVSITEVLEIQQSWSKICSILAL